jgi:hypothetical protein
MKSFERRRSRRLQLLQRLHHASEPAEQSLNATSQPGWSRKSVTMSAATLHLPDVIAGPTTINAALLNELCWCKPCPSSYLLAAKLIFCSACVELAGAWGGAPDIAHSTPCVCSLPDVHVAKIGAAKVSGSRVACSVNSYGIRQVKQCLEAVLVAFEMAGF